MSNTYRYLFAPAATMTKLEAVAVDIFSRQMLQRSQIFLSPESEQVARWAIESSVMLLTLLDEYQHEHDPKSYAVHKTRAKIVQLVQEKGLTVTQVEKILCDRYGIDRLCDLGPDAESDLANYLETI